MNRRIWLALMLLAATLLCGCALRTVEDMYSPPKRSEAYNRLQSAIDDAMTGLSYCAPLSGENQQTVQMADLDGDGVDEYLLFARGPSEKPLQVLIFRQELDGGCVLADVIDSSGSAFEQVEYVDMDDRPGKELIIGRQVSEQVLRSVSVYAFADMQREQLMSASYSKYLTCDLDADGKSELMVISPGETGAENGVAVLYRFGEGAMDRSVEAELSEPVEHIKRIMVGQLDGGVNAVYVASAVNENAILTDIFAIKNGKFTNISFSNESGTSVQTLRNYYVYADDVDDDGILELPGLITMKSVSQIQSSARQYLIRWFSMDIQGREADKLYSFHNYVGGWYMKLDSAWASRAAVEQNANAYTFYAWDEAYLEPTPLFTVYAFSGSDRETQAVEHNRFVLYRGENVVYAGRLEISSAIYGITQEQLINSFRLIRQDWNTGET